MHAFTDASGRVWELCINVSAAKRVRGLLNVDLYKVVDDGFKPLAELLGDPIQLADLLYVLCKDQAEAKQISDEDFGRALYGDVIHSASDAFLEELVDFFPNPRVRQGLRKVIEKSGKMRDLMVERAEVMIDQVNVEEEVNALIGSSGNVPEPLASTPAPSLSGSS